MRTLVPASVATIAIASLALTGCSGASNDSSNSPSGGGSASSQAGFPVTIATKFGDVKITERPQRVVALGWGDAETALELGTQPVGASDWLQFGGNGVGPWDAGKYTSKPTLIGTMEPSYEKIAALHPDVILDTKSSGDKARYDKLSAIAPTVAVPKGAGNYLTSTTQQVSMIAKALGKRAKGKALLAKMQKAFTKAADAHPSWKGKTVSVATRTSEGWGAYVKGDARLEFLKRLGFVQSPRIAKLEPNASGFSVSISNEKLGVLDADLIVAFPIFIPKAKITDNPLWKTIPAVKDGRDIVVSGTISNAFSDGTPGAQLYALRKLVPMIEKTSLGG